MKHSPTPGLRQPGFSLIELLIALVVVALLIGLIASAINQTLSVNAAGSARTQAVRSVDVVIDNLRRDIQMGQSIKPNGQSGFPLEIGWKEWDSGAVKVTYQLEETRLVRSLTAGGSEVSRKVLADNVGLIQINNLPYLAGSLKISITTQVSGFRSASETRTFEVLPRTGT